MNTSNTLQPSRLYEVVDQLVKPFAVNAISNKTHFVNEIPVHLQLSRDPQVIVSVLSGLLNTVLSQAKESCIALSAKLYGNIILVRVNNSGGSNLHGIEEQIQSLLPLTERMRGFISFTRHRNNIDTICLGFSNLPS